MHLIKICLVNKESATREVRLPPMKVRPREPFPALEHIGWSVDGMGILAEEPV